MKKVRKETDEATALAQQYDRAEFSFRFYRVASSKSWVDVVEKLEASEKDEPKISCTIDERLCAYEKMLFLKYKLAQMKSELKEKTAEAICYRKIQFIKYHFEYDFTNCGISYRGPKLRSVENKIDKMPFVHQYSNFGGKGRELNWDTLCANKEIMELIDGYIQDVLQYFQDEIDKIESKAPSIKKAFYSRNLDTYLDLVGVTDQKERDVIYYMYMQCLRPIFYAIPHSCSKDTIKKVCNITEKDWNKIVRSKTFEIFTFSTRDRDCVKRIFPQDEVAAAIFNIDGTKEEFLNALVKRTQKTNFTLDNFKHVKQAVYIKNILENAIKNKTKGVNILIYGKPGTGKTELARTLIQEVGATGYEVDSNKETPYNYLRNASGPYVMRDGEKQNRVRNSIYNTLRASLKNSSNSVIFYDEAEDFFRKDEATDQSKQNINDTLENNPTPTIWTCNYLSPRWIESSFIRRFTYAIELDKINIVSLLDLTEKICKKNNVTINSKIRELIKQERPSIGIVEKCIDTYKLSGVDDIEFLYEGLKDLMYAERYGWDKPKDINRNQTHDYNQNLANTDVKLESITNGVIKSGKNDWSLILYGVSGTGKTAYAEFLGKKLGMRIIKKKVSDLQSPYVGECERQIDEAFEEARQENAILLFDEGDCWLRDRRFNRASWETSQTNQFLQNLEAATTPVIVTTNLMESLDQAALRRFVFKVGFKYMTKPQVKEAFKTFYDIDATDDEANISYATPGDFAVIKKQIEYLGEKPTAGLVKKMLMDEIKNKKDDFKENSMKI